MHRRSPRLSGFDYATSGAYFITICAFRRQRLLGECRNDEIHLNVAGSAIEACWAEIPAHFPAELDAFVVMPNHVHRVLFIIRTGLPRPYRRSSARSSLLGLAR